MDYVMWKKKKEEGINGRERAMKSSGILNMQSFHRINTKRRTYPWKGNWK